MKKFPKDLNDWKEYPGMVRWFSPIVLLKTIKKVLASTLFGQYADRRLVHASLDLIDDETVIEKCCGGEKGLCGEKNQQPIWVDYVADLGDGFDSTYAIAYLIGQKEIQVSNDIKLPRADCLIMGGDQVYPDASREDYERRMERPYELAFPINNVMGSSPPVYLIPGNHDWYDGLTLFLAKFCRGRDTSLGNWLASQSRSYFAVHVAENWWIWGFDSQLGEDIDKPQADYFISVAKRMEPDAKVILCASVPSWLKADLEAPDKKEREAYYRSLHYMAHIISKHCKGAKIPLVISGDLHHYSRYVAKESGTNFITAGGGGAFLHPTHHLNDKIITNWASIKQTLEIGHDGGTEDQKKAVYPPQDISKGLALGNTWFVFKNWDFCLVLGALYWICALLMLAWSGYGESGGTGTFLSRIGNQVNTLWSTPIFVIIALALLAALYKAADIKSIARKRVAVTIHFLAHLTLVLIGTALVSISVVGLKSAPFWGEIIYFFALCIGMIILGFIGGVVWGLYLTGVSWLWGDHANDAFSAMRLDSYRHFIRFKIETNKITIYPIGIDKSPKRGDWELNDSYESGSQDIPIIIPKKELEQHLIEDPIVIDINDVALLTEDTGEDFRENSSLKDASESQSPKPKADEPAVKGSIYAKINKECWLALKMYSLVILGVVGFLLLLNYTSDNSVNNHLNITPKEKVFDLKLKEYELHISLYQYYLNLGLSAITFFYLTTGGILAYILKNYKENPAKILLGNRKIPMLKLSLLLPILLSSVFGSTFIYGGCRWLVVKGSVEILRDELDIKRVPDLQILLQMLVLFGIIFFLVGFILLVFFFLNEDEFIEKTSP